MCSLSKIDFSLAVETYSRENDISLVEACIHVADEHEIEHNEIPKFIYQALYDKIELEAINNKTIKSLQSSSLELLGI